MPEKRVDPRASRDDRDVLKDAPVKLSIGSTEEIIIVHPDVLTKSSEFFKAALKKEWANDNIVNLPNEELDTVNTYVNFLYSGSVCCQTSDRNIRSEYNHLAKLYGLGEKLLDDQFQDRVIDAIVSTCGEKTTGGYVVPGADAISIIYKNTPPASPARKMLVDICCDAGTHTFATYIKAEKSKMPREFFEDLTIASFQRRQQPVQGGWKPQDDDASVYYKQKRDNPNNGKSEEQTEGSAA